MESLTPKNEQISIEQLKNLGPKSAIWLSKIQVHNKADLIELGSIGAYLKMCSLEKFKPNLNFLYAMEAALLDCHWAKINPEIKSALLLQLDETKLYQDMFKKPDSKTIINQTKNWISSFIINHNICPFAEAVFSADKVHYLVLYNENIEDCLIQLIEQFYQLESEPKIETTLMVFPEAVANFDDYLDFLAIANQLIEEQGLTNDFQLASFHPGYCFEGVEQDDPSNFTNRSPWPMLHLLRQSSIEKGLSFYEDAAVIPERNIEYTRELGYSFLADLREQSLRIK